MTNEFGIIPTRKKPRNNNKEGFIMISEFRNKVNCCRKFFILALGSFFLIWLYGHNLTWAQEKEYPNKPIKIVLPFSPGGVTDLAVRAMTDYLSQELKVPVLVENKGGAEGMIGASMVLKAPPDGYTLLAGSDPPLVWGPMFSPNPPYDPFKDFLPVGGFGVSAAGYAVHASSPLKTIADFVSEAKRNPGKLSAALTQIDHRLGFEKFKKVAGMDVKIIPFPAVGEAIAAVLGKHADLLCLSYPSLRPYINSGEVRLILVDFPLPGSSVPTFAEAGYPEAAGVAMFTALQVSAKTPKPIHEKLVTTLKRVANNPELRKKWENVGIIPDYKTPTEISDDLKKKWDTVSEFTKEFGPLFEK
jgi:tripartite-type tricarboxylate transporter receptor subunit TctC